MNQIMICPSEIKKKILLKNQESLTDVKFYSKREFFSHYFYDVDEKTIYYLMKNYHISYSIAKEYISYLYIIEDKDYKSDKLNFLKQIKKELLENNLLILSPVFREYLKDKTIDATSYYDLDLYEEKALQTKQEIPEVVLNFPIYEFSTLEEEVHFVCVKIRELLKKKVPLSKIFLCNVTEEYFFTLDKMFSFYHIPIEIPFQNSIYSTPIVQEYLKTGFLDPEKNDFVTKSLRSLIGQLMDLDEDEIKREILIEESKNIRIPNI